MIQQQLPQLCREFPLCRDWSDPEPIADTVDIGRLSVRRAALLSRGPDGAEATGSAAETGADPLARSYFELVERMSILEAMRAENERLPAYSVDGRFVGTMSAAEVFPESEAPERWRYARSNAVAVHTSWERACAGAWWEAIERDRVLRAWRGEMEPVPVDAWEVLRDFGVDVVGYEWEAALLPPVERSVAHGARDTVSAVIVGFPVHPDRPLVRGFAARATSYGALAAAARECIQNLAFLWDEQIPHETPSLEPSPMLHLEHFLVPARHELLWRWLRGEHRQHASVPAEAGEGEVRFVDLTPAELRGRLHVVKALCPGAVPLGFGAGFPELEGLPEALRLHPVA